MLAFDAKHLDKLLEEVVAVVGAGGGFGVVLDAEGGEVAVADAFDGLVVEAAVGDFEMAGERVFVDGKTVVLRRDFDRAGFELLDRLIGAAMAKFHFEGFGSASKR